MRPARFERAASAYVAANRRVAGAGDSRRAYGQSCACAHFSLAAIPGCPWIPRPPYAQSPARCTKMREKGPFLGMGGVLLPIYSGGAGEPEAAACGHGFVPFRDLV